MSSFMTKLKEEAEIAAIKEHDLVKNNYSTEVRNAYFAGVAAAACFIDSQLDERERKYLTKLGKSLHISEKDIEEIFSGMDIDDSEKMPYLKEIFSVMDSDYLKYALLTDMKDMMSQKGEMTSDEKEFLQLSAEILFGGKTDIFALWDNGMKLDNISACMKNKEIFKELGNLFTIPEAAGLEMIRIPAGTFMMGSPEGEIGRSDYESRHSVTLTKDFWLGKFPVTQKQWRAIMKDSPLKWKGDDFPVDQITWYDAMKFCELLNDKYESRLPEGYKFSLPTEAQWEYACRAGTTGAWYGEIDDVAWYNDNSGNSDDSLTDIRKTVCRTNRIAASSYSMCYVITGGIWGDPDTHDIFSNSGNQTHEDCINLTHEVGQKAPNSFGLYDLLGNVWEWCYDEYSYEYAEKPECPPAPSTDKVMCVYRGGSWYEDAKDCRAAIRNYCSVDHCFAGIGFRLALRAVDKNEQKSCIRKLRRKQDSKAPEQPAESGCLGILGRTFEVFQKLHNKEFEQPGRGIFKK